MGNRLSLFSTREFVALNKLQLLQLGAHSLLLGPERGTFGGFSDGAPLEAMRELAKMARTEFPGCSVKLAPAGHDIHHFSRSMFALTENGFAVNCVDMNYELACGNIAGFADGLESGARKKLAKCERAGFESRLLERLDWARAWALLADNRTRNGHTLALPLGQILALEAKLPGTHHFFGTFTRSHMIAAAITLQCQPDITAIYAWGDAEKNEYAPTVQLCEAIYQWACAHNCTLVDAGISTERGKASDGLMRFKTSLGFLPSVKITMGSNDRNALYRG